MQYVKENAVEIIAELRGMVEKWKEQGMPLRTNLNFRFRAWAQTIGGILYANGYVDFLKNIDSSEQEMNTEVHDLKDLAADAKNKYMSAQDWAILAESKYVFSELKNKSLRAKSQFISAVFKRYSNDSMCDDNNYFQIKQQLNQKKNGIEWAFIDIAKTEKTEPSEIAIDEITEISETPAEKKVVSGIVSELQPPDNKESSETSETSETFSDHVVSQTNFNNNIFCSQGGIRDIVSEVSENHIVSENLGKGGNDLDFE